MIVLIDDGDEKSKSLFEMFGGTKVWKIETFCVKRLFLNGTKEFDTAESDYTFGIKT